MLIVYGLTIFTGAALLFVVQPMVGRMVLPLLGGSPAVWNTAMVFYQAVLLAGYAYAHFTTRWLGIRRQARVNPLRAVARISARLRAVATGVAATGVTIRGDRVHRVATSAGEVTPAAVVFATGRPPVLDGLPLLIPSERVKGHLLVTGPAPVRLPGIVAPLATQIEDGRLLAGGTFDVGDESPAVQPEVIESIMEALCTALPELRGLGIDYQWCCFRPRHPDRRPVIDRVPGLANAWLTSGHFRTGILNAPATASALARWISAGEPPAEQSSWSAGRFARR